MEIQKQTSRQTFIYCGAFSKTFGDFLEFFSTHVKPILAFDLSLGVNFSIWASPRSVSHSLPNAEIRKNRRSFEKFS